MSDNAAKTKMQHPFPLSELFTNDRRPQSTADYFDRRAPIYDQEMLHLGYNGSRYSVEHLVKALPDRNAHILVVGAGTGVEGDLLHEQGYVKLDALDGSAGMIRHCEQRAVFTNCYHISLMENEPCILTDQSYDCILSVGTFLPGCLHAGHMDELLRMVRHNGLLVLGVEDCFLQANADPHINYDFDLHQKLQQLEKQGSVRIETQIKKTDFFERARWTDGTVFVIRKT